jgi:hypothetical protein
MEQFIGDPRRQVPQGVRVLEGLSDDGVYRLKKETMAGDPNGLNGALTYPYDSVGNRQQPSDAGAGYRGGCGTTTRTTNSAATTATATLSPAAA